MLPSLPTGSLPQLPGRVQNDSATPSCLHAAHSTQKAYFSKTVTVVKETHNVGEGKKKSRTRGPYGDRTRDLGVISTTL